MSEPETSPAAVAACCAQFYEQDWVRGFLGESFHPGGESLTRRLLQSLELTGGSTVLDAACGLGTTARILADEFAAKVTALDYSRKNIARARERHDGTTDLHFCEGSVAALPVASGMMAAVVCECAVSTFAEKDAAIAEFARVLQPAGKVAISDMAVHGTLPEELQRYLGPWTCVEDALSTEGYVELFARHGLTLKNQADESEALLELTLDLKRKLALAGLGQMSGFLGGIDLDVATLRKLLEEAREVVRAGTVRYVRLLFVRP